MSCSLRKTWFRFGYEAATRSAYGCLWLARYSACLGPLCGGCFFNALVMYRGGMTHDRPYLNGVTDLTRCSVGCWHHWRKRTWHGPSAGCWMRSTWLSRPAHGRALRTRTWMEFSGRLPGGQTSFLLLYVKEIVSMHAVKIAKRQNFMFELAQLIVQDTEAVFALTQPSWQTGLMWGWCWRNYCICWNWLGGFPLCKQKILLPVSSGGSPKKHLQTWLHVISCNLFATIQCSGHNTLWSTSPEWPSAIGKNLQFESHSALCIAQYLKKAWTLN